LHMAQLMPLPLTVSCFSKIQIGFTFLVPAHLGSPGKRAVKRMCVCVCVWWHSQKLVLIELSNKAWVEVPQSIGENIMEYCSAWTVKPEPPVWPVLVEIQTAAVSCCLYLHVCLRYFV